jgi:hypothetical protein
MIAPFVGNVVLGRNLQLTFCECEALASLRHMYLGSFFLDRRILGYWMWGPTGTSLKDQGSYNQVQIMGYKGPVIRPRWVRSKGARTQLFFYSVLYRWNCMKCKNIHTAHWTVQVKLHEMSEHTHGTPDGAVCFLRCYWYICKHR